MAKPRFYTPSSSGDIQVSDNGGTSWFDLASVTDVGISGGDRAETTTETINGESVTSVGAPSAKDISITANVAPASKGFQIVDTAYRLERTIQFRFVGDNQEVLDNQTATNTLAIAVNSGNAKIGDVTATANVKMQSSPVFQVGRGIVIANTLYIIESITSETQATVVRSDGEDVTAVTATGDWAVWDYGVTWTVECTVLSAGNPSFSAGGTPTTETLSFKSVGLFPKPTFTYS